MRPKVLYVFAVFILSFLLLVNTASATNTLNGTINNTYGINIQNARIDFNGSYVISTSDGYYSFSNIQNGSYIILVRQIGYNNKSQSVSISDNKTLNLTLLEKMGGMPVEDKGIPGFERIFAIIGLLIIYMLRRKK